MHLDGISVLFSQLRDMSLLIKMLSFRLIYEQFLYVLSQSTVNVEKVKW